MHGSVIDCGSHCIVLSAVCIGHFGCRIGRFFDRRCVASAKGSLLARQPSLHGFQTIHHRQCRRGAIIRFFLQQLVDQFNQCFGCFWIDHLQRDRFLTFERIDDFGDTLAFKRSATGLHRIHHAAERIQIGSQRDPITECLFGRHVVDCAEDRTGDSLLTISKNFRDPKVDQLDRIVLRQQQIGWL